MSDNRYGHPYYLRLLVICCLLTILSGIIFSQIEFEREGSRFCLNRAQKRSQIIPDCKQPNYKARILMYEPFMMHIENFVSPEERAHLLQLGQPLLEPSLVLQENGTKSINEARTSRSAFLSRNDPVSQCIMERASELQGMVSTGRIENLQVTAYKEGQRYQPHFDWFDNKVHRRQGGSNRGSTFFVTLEADCENCGTRFPRVQVDWKLKDSSWCKFVDCGDTQALTAHAVPGSALFWRNLNASGLGDERTLHEGLPLPRGTKTGLNIWTIEYP